MKFNKSHKLMIRSGGLFLLGIVVGKCYPSFQEANVNIMGWILFGLGIITLWILYKQDLKKEYSPPLIKEKSLQETKELNNSKSIKLNGEKEKNE